MRFLITGGAGFIGSNIAARLVENGDQVRILDNFSSGRRENIEGLPDLVEVIEGDVRDYWTVARAVEGAYMIWAAWRTQSWRSLFGQYLATLRSLCTQQS